VKVRKGVWRLWRVIGWRGLVGKAIDGGFESEMYK
jgi:hypothetical protein